MNEKPIDHPFHSLAFKYASLDNSRAKPPTQPNFNVGEEVIHDAVLKYCEWANPPHPCLQSSDVVRLARLKGKKF